MAVSVPVKCPKCGKQLFKLGAGSKSKNTVTCPNCRSSFDISALRHLDEGVRELQGALSKLGRKR